MGSKLGSRPVRAAVSILALGFAVFGGVHWWVNTRTLVPLDTPLSLAPGHSQTDKFELNVEGFFYIDVRFPYGGNCDGESLVTRRRLFAGEEMISVSDTWNTEKNGVVHGMSLGGFQGKPGSYRLEVEVVSAARSIDACHPTLQIAPPWYVFNEWEEIEGLSSAFCVFCTVLGAVVILMPLFARSEERSLEEVRLRLSSTTMNAKPFEDIVAGRAQPSSSRWLQAQYWPSAGRAWGITGLRSRHAQLRQVPSRNPLWQLPTISIICVLTLFGVATPMWVLYAWGQGRSTGLMVRLPQKERSSVAAELGLTAPLIQVEATGSVYLNYRKTTWEALPTELDRALIGLPVRVVYVDGEDEATFGDAVRAIDLAEGLHARVILMTPQSRRLE